MLPVVSAFLTVHNFPVEMSIANAVNSILYDMRLGLKDSGKKSSEAMCRTWVLPPKELPKNQSVLVMDAGGTNFRSCLVNFDAEGKVSVSDFKKTKMPGIERELSKEEFFNQIADNIDYLKNKADRIGFCFSYVMEITKDGDGIPKAFAKEVKAKEVVGVPVGKSLVEVLEKRGWNKIKRVTLLNDTAAALLAGAAISGSGVKYSSYIGFILGTGMNAAYIQPKDSFVDSDFNEQIIVCESGMCDKVVHSDFDIALDKKTALPGDHLLEKGCSGLYLGKLGFEMLNFAADNGLFSEETASKIREIKELTLIEMDSFLYNPYKPGLISDLTSDENEKQIIYELFDVAVDRCARNAASIISACAIQSDAGKNPLHPISVLCNGTTFYKTHKLRARVEKYLESYLFDEKGISYEIVSADDDITIGTAVAGLI
ncbi:hexokinase [Treponema zioleckii]|uniref:hexokinase n=1 Tax=Treponema zioleckii TaxID=331680 RepID=UPI00168BE121|nr:hexokinase [Treponema zioleckii]